MHAAYNGHPSIVERLLVAGASPGIKTNVSDEIVIPSSYVCVGVGLSVYECVDMFVINYPSLLTCCVIRTVKQL